MSQPYDEPMPYENLTEAELDALDAEADAELEPVYRVKVRAPKKVYAGPLVSEAAEILGVSPRRVRAFIDQGRLGVIGEDPVQLSADDVAGLKAERDRQGLTPVAAPKAPTLHDLADGMQAIVQAMQVLGAGLYEVQVKLAETPAIRPRREPKAITDGTPPRPARASVRTDDVHKAVQALTKHYTADELRAALDEVSENK